LEFREAEADWSPVPFTPAAAGKTSWSVARSGSVSIRGRIQDRAGNEATAESQLNVTVPAAPASPAPSTPARYSRQPIADGAPPEGDARAPRALGPARSACGPPRRRVAGGCHAHRRGLRGAHRPAAVAPGAALPVTGPRWRRADPPGRCHRPLCFANAAARP